MVQFCLERTLRVSLCATAGGGGARREPSHQLQAQHVDIHTELTHPSTEEKVTHTKTHNFVSDELF